MYKEYCHFFAKIHLSRNPLIPTILVSKKNQLTSLSKPIWMRYLHPSHGNCYDYAVVESDLGSLKIECIRAFVYPSRRQAKLALFDYMELFYNRQRLHAALDYVLPVEFAQMNAIP